LPQQAAEDSKRMKHTFAENPHSVLVPLCRIGYTTSGLGWHANLC
jgi:hypothetical protein